MNKIEIFVTLGPSSLNKKFLNFVNRTREVSLVRLNMSHVSLNKLENKILFIKKNCNVPICIDTEGAQIRMKTSSPEKKRNIKTKSIVKIHKHKGNYNLYPEKVFDLIKERDLLDIGFEGLQLKVIKKNSNILKLICTRPGTIENNKGVHLNNRKIQLDYVTDKDLEAIKIAKNHLLKNYALSFTNSKSDIDNFCKLLPNENKYFKIETLKGLKSIDYFFKKEKNFLIDRGDLSKDIGIENVPFAQRLIFKKSKKNKKKIKIAVATNFLETMIKNPYPTRAEVNDIYNSLEMGAKVLVLAGETAMGKYPIECVKILTKIIKVFKKKNK